MTAAPELMLCLTQKREVYGLGRCRTLNSHLRYDTQSPLRANEQVFQMVACVVFLQCVQAIHHLTVCQHLRIIMCFNRRLFPYYIYGLLYTYTRVFAIFFFFF